MFDRYMTFGNTTRATAVAFALSVLVPIARLGCQVSQPPARPTTGPVPSSPAAPQGSTGIVLPEQLTRPATDTLNANARKAQQTQDTVLLDSIAKAMKDASTRSAILSVIQSRGNAQAEIDKGLNAFGADIFRRGTSLFDANDAGPVPPDYRLGVGDQLVLVLTGDVEQVYELPITREGSVFVPNVGGIRVANLTMSQLEEVLLKRLQRVYSGMGVGPGSTAHFTVTVSSLGSSQVAVLGDVQTPGTYKISKLGTILTALYASGGPTENGSMRQVRVMRGGVPIAVVDLYNYLLSGNTTNLIGLQSGDVVFVPPRGPRVRVSGAVLRPATYELLSGETLDDAVRMAGGFRAEADRRRVQIERVLPPARRIAAGKDRELFDVTTASLEVPRERLYDDDVVTVATVAGHVANRVTVSGNVWSAGAVAFVPGMKLSDALARTGGVKPGTYQTAQVSRLQPDLTHRIVRVHVPGVPGATAEPDVIGTDIELQADDEVRVYSLGEYRPDRPISIDGAVRSPISMTYTEGMTLRDLVMQAGGLAEGALLAEAEIARMPEQRTNGATAKVFRVPLDSTYLLERRPDGTYLGPPGLVAAARGAPNVALEPYDQVLILRQPDFALPRNVTLSGEVRFPGKYALKSKSERLSDIIERAGGLTPEAYAEGIDFERANSGTGRIGIDLPEVLRNRNSIDNLLLLDGDRIEIPMRSSVVRVTGAVNSPLVVPYVPGADLEYYVYAAGGVRDNADKDHAFVLQPNGKVQTVRSRILWSSKPTPQPGSTVTVPEKKVETHFDPAALLTATTSILTSLVAITAILRR